MAFGFIGDAVDKAEDIAGDASGVLFGTSKDPGLLGLSKQEVPKHTIDKNNFQNAQSQQDQANLKARLAGIDARQSPTMGGTTIGAYQNAGLQQAAPYQGSTYQGSAYQSSGPIERAQAGTLGPASQSAIATINRGEDQQVRGSQMQLIDALQKQAAGNGTGQQLAKQAYDTANEQSLRNALAIAASRRGTQAPSTAGILDATGADRLANAANLTKAKMEAALQAEQQLADVTNAARNQDINVNTSQAGLADAGFARNQDAINNFRLSQFAANNDMSKFNAGNYIQNQQFNTANALQNNQFNADNLLKNSMFNAGNVMANNQFNSKLAADIGMFNAGQQNERTGKQSDLDLATRQANLESQLKTMGMNDNMAQYYSDAVLRQQEADRQANIDYENLLTNQELGIDRLDMTAFDNARASRQAAVGGVADLVGSAAAGSGKGEQKSDRRSKTEIRLLQPDTWSFGAR